MNLAKPLLLTKEQVAELLNISPLAAYNLHRLKKLPAVSLNERTLRWRMVDVEKFVEKLAADD